MSNTSTESIRNEVTELAPSEKAIWPNGLGFEWRSWSYRCVGNGWKATTRKKSGVVWFGTGETPADAKANAYPLPE